MKKAEVKNVVKNVNVVHRRKISAVDRFAEKFTGLVGSWSFIVVFVLFNTLWLLLNTYYLLFVPFDPYPFIFLNLVLAFLAALQAPIILINQSRQEKKDRIRAENDYRVDLHSAEKLEEISKCLERMERKIERTK
ncbi:DUF1003 domain-containing protein [Patescibacteria group bacterium]|nr:DUF1003 domain-containing protein [Patescibacteria group bacterium]